jgi:hypothetical protein
MLRALVYLPRCIDAEFATVSAGKMRDIWREMEFRLDVCHATNRSHVDTSYVGDMNTTVDRCTPVRFHVLTAATMKMTVFWGVAPCSLVEVYRRFIRATSDVGKLLPDYMAQQTRRKLSSFSSQG